MKIAVMNFSGNVGKTTVAAQLLRPRMNNAPIISVESLNVDASADGVEVEKMKGKQFGDLQEQILLVDDVIVDVGASNVEEFLKRMQQYHGSHEEFDLFVVPTVKEKKQQADTVNTIRALASLGVPKSKIRLVFNKVEVDEAIEDEFSMLCGLAVTDKSFTLKQEATIHSNEIFERIKAIGKSLGEITNDETDYRAKLREATSDEEKQFCVSMITLKRLAVTANKNLDDVYKAITSK